MCEAMGLVLHQRRHHHHSTPTQRPSDSTSGNTSGVPNRKLQKFTEIIKQLHLLIHYILETLSMKYVWKQSPILELRHAWLLDIE